MHYQHEITIPRLTSAFILRTVLAGAAELIASGLRNLGYPVHVRGRNREANRWKGNNLDRLVTDHFATRSTLDHINLTSMLETVQFLGKKSCIILETGSSAWGTNSSQLFDDYVTAFGGEFWSVDIRLEPLLKLRRELGPNSVACCDDSVRFLKRWVKENPGRKVDLVYLDSLDLDVSSPMPAALHALHELVAVQTVLGSGSLLLVDDTPAGVDWFPESEREAARRFQAVHGILPGKGMLIELFLSRRPDVTKVLHRYQVLYCFGNQ